MKKPRTMKLKRQNTEMKLGKPPVEVAKVKKRGGGRGRIGKKVKS